jgi:hypothetical protein
MPGVVGHGVEWCPSGSDDKEPHTPHVRQIAPHLDLSELLEVMVMSGQQDAGIGRHENLDEPI